MGTVSGVEITKAARYLMEILGREGSVPYSGFYDGTDETERSLAAQLDVDPRYTSVAILFDLAVFHLEHQDLVEKSDLPARLADGEPDYRITLTPRGKRFWRDGGEVVCPHTEL